MGKLLVVGSVALDTVKTPFGEGTEILGGSATYFSTAASFFTSVALIAVVGEDFPQQHIAFLKSRGIDLTGLERRPGATFRWKGEYTHQLNEAHTLDTQLNVFETFRPQIPEAYLAPDVLFLGNIHPELQLDVLQKVHRPALVACDTMNFWINGQREAGVRRTGVSARRRPRSNRCGRYLRGGISGLFGGDGKSFAGSHEAGDYLRKRHGVVYRRSL